MFRSQHNNNATYRAIFLFITNGEELDEHEWLLFPDQLNSHIVLKGFQDVACSFSFRETFFGLMFEFYAFSLFDIFITCENKTTKNTFFYLHRKMKKVWYNWQNTIRTMM